MLKATRMRSLLLLAVLALDPTGRLYAQPEPAAVEPTLPQSQTEPPAAPVEATPVATPAPDAAPPATTQSSDVQTPATPSSGAEVDVSAYLSGSESGDASGATDTMGLRFYGFADFGVNYVGAKETETFTGVTPALFLGNLNLYAASDLSERWKSLVEIRFTFLPDGSLDSNLNRISTAGQDYGNLGARIHWGGISIERAWLEYSAHELLNIRGGVWLTPVGIWNVDHGTPTIIPALRPFVINSASFPSRQTGIEIYGSRLFGETTLGYHLTLSNGRGSLSSYSDLDKNKAIGARLLATFALGESTLTLGSSLYTGRSTDAGVRLSATGLSLDTTAQFDELALAGDLLFKWEGLHLQGELLSRQVKYTKAGAVAPALPGPQGGVLPDYVEIGGYMLLGYRLPWFPLMPFLEFDNIVPGDGTRAIFNAPRRVTTYSGGLNYRPIATVTLKAQYMRLIFVSLQGKANPTDQFMAIAAWSF